MFKIKNSTGYRLLLPDGRYAEKDELIGFNNADEIPMLDDIVMIGCRDNVFIHFNEYYRDSFGEIHNEFRVSPYLF